MIGEDPADRVSDFQASGCLEPVMGSHGEKSKGVRN